MSVIVEAVTVSVNYSYYLSKCISNKEKLDRWIVVTEKQDTKCINLCKSNNIEYVLYDGFYINNAIFAKGRGVNFGLSLLDKTDWLLHMDSDVCLPEDFKPVLEKKLNDKNSLYWGKRYFSNDKEMRFITEDGWEHKWIGFFQLWHSSFKTEYPHESLTCSYDDVIMKESFNSFKELPIKLLDVQDDLYVNEEKNYVWRDGRDRKNPQLYGGIKPKGLK